jgi:hypothetical protein
MDSPAGELAVSREPELGAHLALEPGQFLVDVWRTLPGWRGRIRRGDVLDVGPGQPPTVVVWLADLPVGALAGNLLA